MPVVDLGKSLQSSSGSLVTCARKIEKHLKDILNLAESCSPESAIVTADSLTKLTRDVALAPFFMCKGCKDGKDIRNVFAAFCSTLRNVKPEEVNSKSTLDAALLSTKKECRKRSLTTAARKCCQSLVKNIAHVFQDLRASLQKETNGPTRQLFRAVRRYMKDVRRSIICASYNSFYLSICLKSLDHCKGDVKRDQMRVIMKNVHHVCTKCRTMAILPHGHREVLLKAKKMR